MSLRLRTFMTILVIAANLGITWMIASLSELMLQTGLVRYVALAVFAGGAAIDFVALSWFLSVMLLQLGRHDERNRDLVAINETDRLLVRSDEGAKEFRELNEQPMRPISVFVPSRRRHALPLASAELDDALVRRLVKGGNSHGQQHIRS